MLLSEGRAQEAQKELAAETSPWWQAIGQVMVYDALGRRAEADALLAQIESKVMSWQYQIAQIYAHRHDRERALLWLDRAYRARDPGFVNYLKCDPMLSELHTDPRYQALLAQLHLPP